MTRSKLLAYRHIHSILMPNNYHPHTHNKLLLDPRVESWMVTRPVDSSEITRPRYLVHRNCSESARQRQPAGGQGSVIRVPSEITLWLKRALTIIIIIIIIIIIWFGDTVTVTHLTKCITNSKVRAMSA